MLVPFLLYMVADANRRGYRHLIDGFWDEAQSFGLALPCEKPVTSSALSKARHKITPELMRALLHQASDSFDEQFGVDKRWCGRRVFAVDGSKVNIQRGEELAHAFGVPNGAHCPQVLVSTLFDLVAKVPHDITVAPHESGERQAMLRMLDRLKTGDVLVLDRGYGPGTRATSVLLFPSTRIHVPRDRRVSRFVTRYGGMEPKGCREALRKLRVIVLERFSSLVRKSSRDIVKSCVLHRTQAALLSSRIPSTNRYPASSLRS